MIPLRIPAEGVWRSPYAWNHGMVHSLCSQGAHGGWAGGLWQGRQTFDCHCGAFSAALYAWRCCVEGMKGAMYATIAAWTHAQGDCRQRCFSHGSHCHSRCHRGVLDPRAYVDTRHRVHRSAIDGAKKPRPRYYRLHRSPRWLEWRYRR
jgi:hypothetical protein